MFNLFRTFLVAILCLHSLVIAETSLLRKADTEFTKEEIKQYLLPKKHPLQACLKHIFSDPNMFKSGSHLTNAGFEVKRGHAKLMVAAHPYAQGFLFKKFPDNRPQDSQLRNFIKRIKGAKKVRHVIKTRGFKHLVVPKKWLYKLPSMFSKNGQPSYILIVEKMDVYTDWKDPNGMTSKLYYNMPVDVLTELCMTLHALGGCDAFPRNQPFTRDGKIAFVDTEHVGKFKGHFLKHIVPALNEELQSYAVALWMKLECEAKHK